MKKYFSTLLFVLLFSVLFVQQKGVSAQAQQISTPNMNDIKHITAPFFEAIANNNIAVRVSFQCKSNYRADWLDGTYMRLTGKAVIWTDFNGQVNIDLPTMPPPMALNGRRPPMTLHTAPMDADGNIVVGDKDYWILYRVWSTRPCVRFSQLLQDNAGIASAWHYWIQGRTDMAKYSRHWQALGLNPDGTVASWANMAQPIALNQIVYPDLGEAQLDWTYDGEYVQVTDPAYQEAESDSSLPIIPIAVFVVLAGIAIVMIKVGRREREVA